MWIRSGLGRVVYLVDTDAFVLAGQSGLPPVVKSDPIPPSRRQSSRSSGRSRIAAWFQLESLCRSPSLVPPQIVPRFEKVSRLLPIKTGTAGSRSSLTRTFLSSPGHDLCENFRASRDATRTVSTSRRRLRRDKLSNRFHILP